MFRIEENSAAIRVYFQDELACEFDIHDWRSTPPKFTDVRLKPGGEKVLYGLDAVPFPLHGKLAEPHVAAEVSSEGVRISLTCGDRDSNVEQRTHFAIEHDATMDRLNYTCVYETDVLKTHTPNLYFQPRNRCTAYDGKGVWFWEFTDPCFERIMGPATSITHDRPDVTCPVPLFKKGGWEKRWTCFVYGDDQGNLIEIPHNHQVSWEKYNWRHTPEGFTALLGEPGLNLVFRDLPGMDPIVHYICMWAYDLHCNYPVEGSPHVPPVFEKGRTLRNGFRLELLDDEEAVSIQHKAVPYELCEEDRRRRRVPRYVNGVNLLDRECGWQDEHFPWTPASVAHWIEEDRSLFLENLDTVYEAGKLRNTWEALSGSSHFGDPIKPGAHYRLRAEVKTEAVVEPGGARIGLQRMSGEHLGTVNERAWWSEVAWSEPLTLLNDWTMMEASVEVPAAVFTCELRLVLELNGPGRAWFRNIELSSE